VVLIKVKDGRSVVFLRRLHLLMSQPNLHHPAREIDAWEPNLDGCLNDSKRNDFSGEAFSA
jgi:hypothetical protein